MCKSRFINLKCVYLYGNSTYKVDRYLTLISHSYSFAPAFLSKNTACSVEIKMKKSEYELPAMRSDKWTLDYANRNGVKEDFG